ncbi:uncharacterized protein LOC100838077 [Brachypodium distachyon]|uniref:Uncharacterized protein n=1 Tax=Brachypodium distachyon TaxID=15368 RepID=A0A0Q3MFY6_BRADI|nr:uncharacterized protein LOC100838077 [Brachypodium distachyon]KQK03350.1 hypothetical protein BRADI_2g07293v3 [Brachypodium distachyon]|eukprot:XP_003565725.1 uncharacterized protein LOC100838077 [Brachypodium distachyon]
MEGSSSRTPEITIVPAPRPAAGGGAVDAVKAATKEPVSPGSPSPASRKESQSVSVSVPGWKLDSLCRESGSPPAMMGRFPYF